MKKILLIFLSVSLLIYCANRKKAIDIKKSSSVDFTIAFGSCNKQNKTNILWKEVLKNGPNLWIWGGDIIYSDTQNMDNMKEDYHTLLNQKNYQSVKNRIPIMATWDDHDYGLNDGGIESIKKKEAQQLFLDFLGIDKNHERRSREGIYHSKVFNSERGSIKVFVLDTRYHRTALTKSKGRKRYQPNHYGVGTILGDKQWNWLANELESSQANFNVIVSSIQVLSAEHGFETWGNFPHEVEKLIKTIKNSNAKKVILLSGDRHISEFSKISVEGLPYSLFDFTSSGLTHSYKGFTSEPNQYRVKNVVSTISFGVLKFNFDKNEVLMQMRGKNNEIQQELIHVYE